MQKPSDLVIEDVKKELYDTINASNLPITVIELLIKEIADTVAIQKSELVARLRKEYTESITAETIKRKAEEK